MSDKDFYSYEDTLKFQQKCQQQHLIITAPTSYILVSKVKDLAKTLAPIQNSKILGIDCETTGIDAHLHKLRLVTIAAPKYPVIVIDLFAIAPADRAPLRQLLTGAALKLGHNFKFDWQFLTQAGLKPATPYFDTQLAYKVLTAGLKVSSSLQAVAQKLLGIQLDKSQQLSDFSIAKLTNQQLEYAATDAAILLQLYPILVKKLKQDKLLAIAQLEFSCLPATAQIELNGMHLNLESWQKTKATLDAQIAAVLVQIRQLKPPDKPQQVSLFPELANNGINPNSPKQVLETLHALGIPVQSTNQRHLVPVAEKHPAIKAILEYRHLSKIASTLSCSLPDSIHPLTGRIHPTYYQLGARSGRFSCRNPALQTIPREANVRRCFTADAGCQIIKADYSQIELRIAAKISGDRRMLRAYRRGEDLHRLTAALVTGKPLDQVTEEDRRLAKAINFGLIYGMGAAKLQSQAQVKYGVIMSSTAAKQFRQRFFEAYTLPRPRASYRRFAGCP